MIAPSTTCVACGGPITQSFPGQPDFCSRECFRRGRAFCKQCGEPLLQTAKTFFKRAYCSELCRRKYYHHQTNSLDDWEDYKRTTCKNCGTPIQPKSRGKKLFCSDKCKTTYYYAYDHSYSLNDEWGNYAPETRRVLRELGSLNLSGTARRLALAIDREYKMRRVIGSRSRLITCQCKTCGKEFRRTAKSGASKDYCMPRCNPQSKPMRGARTLLTQEDVDEIRSLYSSGQWSQKPLALKYSVSYQTISSIVTYRTWQLEFPGYEKKLTWEKVDEIRNLAATEQITQGKIAEKYSISSDTVHKIITCKTWKPENDPRCKQEENEGGHSAQQ